jgi:hypothetical protein
MPQNDYLAVDESRLVDGAVSGRKLDTGLQEQLANQALLASTAVEAVTAHTRLVITGADDADGSVTFTIQAFDGGGAELAEQVEVHVWTSGRAGADLGVAVAIATTFAPTTGVIMSTHTAAADFVILSDANGTIVMDADDDQDGALYCMAALGGRVVSIAATATGHA